MTNSIQVAVTAMPKSAVSDWLIPVITTLIGAGLGAWLGAVFAFRKDRKLRLEASDKVDHSNAHRMLFVLTQQYQILWNLKRCVDREKSKADLEKKPIFAPVNEIKFNTTDFSFKGQHASAALPGLMIAERAYLQALDALQCYNLSHETFVRGLKQHLLEPDKVPSDMVGADLAVKVRLLCELCDAVSKAQQRQAAVYSKFCQYLQGRWPTWIMPENIESLVGDFNEIFAGAGKPLETDVNKKTQLSENQETGMYETYRWHASTLRTWLVAYGIGAPVLVLNQDKAWDKLISSGSIRCIGIMFLSGVALQVLLAFVNKTVMWVCDYGDTNEEFKKTCRYNLSACVSKQYWIDFLMDLMSLALFAYATVLVFNKLTK